MQVEITYIFHNCFILKFTDKTFLFDYPADEYLTDARRHAIISRTRDTNLYICSSHNHHDHFNRNVPNSGLHAKSMTYILSKDIVKNNRQFKTMPSCYTMEANQSYAIGDFTVDTFLSNDKGVAFLIHLGPINVYFGGDLANWNWDDLSKAEKRLLVDYYGEVLRKLNQWTVHIAFSNTDRRLANWAGAMQFMETVKPGLFVPMHTFGNTESLAKFVSENPVPVGTKFFQYRETGDSLVWKV